jgi:hypothetical protein
MIRGKPYWAASTTRMEAFAGSRAVGQIATIPVVLAARHSRVPMGSTLADAEMFYEMF